MKKEEQPLGNPLIPLAMMAAGGKGGPQFQPGQNLLSDRQYKVMKNLAIGGGILVGTGAVLWLVSQLNKNRKQAKATANANLPGEPEYYAQRLKEAFSNGEFFGMGTDEEAVREVVVAVPDLRTWEKVKKAYGNLTRGRSLDRDLMAELATSEMQEIRYILATKPQNGRSNGQITSAHFVAWARRIKAACDYQYSIFWPMGTDEAAIYQVFREVPTARDFCRLDQTYRSLFQIGLLAQLSDELDTAEMRKAYQIITNKPDAKGKKLTTIFAQCGA